MCTGRARFHSVEIRAYVVSRQVQHLASELPIFLDLRLGLRRSPSEFAMCIASARRLTLVQSPCKDIEGSLRPCRRLPWFVCVSQLATERRTCLRSVPSSDP